MKATYQDLFNIPDNKIGEIVSGELIVSPLPSPKQSYASHALNGELHSTYQKGDSNLEKWIFLRAVELHLGEHVLVPDLAGWRKERLPHPPEGHGITIAPDWVCEVISPSSVRTDRVLKMPRYAEFEVRYLWIVNPIVKTLEAYKLEGGSWRLLSNHSDDDKIRVEPFHEIELDLSGLWLE